MALEAGTRLGPYEIVELRGKGGMGEVYRARDTRLDRDVAIKVLPAELSEDETYRKRLEREAKTISQLQHPNVCMLLDIGSEGGTLFLVMEYLKGETLEDRLRKGGLPVDDVLRVGSEIAEAVEAAHRAGVVHRDLKPGNVMLTKTGTKVLDFGLAREIASPGDVVNTQAATVPAITQEGAVVGTMPYMTPEQLQGSQADSRTDIWALGCILYEMATGDRPFRGKTQASLIGAILKDDPEPPTRKQPLTPERLDWIVKRCLEKDPERRWQSSRDLAIELRDLRAKADEDDGPPIAKPRTTWIRLAVAAVVIVIGVGSWWLVNQTGESTAEVGPGLDSESSTVLGSTLAAGLDDRASTADLSGDRPMIVVLPFENLGPAEQAYFAAGMTEAVTSRLARLPDLGVISRNSAVQYAGSEKSIRQMGEELSVDWVLEGTVLWAGDRVRITQQLIRVADDTHLWAEDYERQVDVANLFEIQSEIAEDVSRQLDLSLLAPVVSGSAALATTSEGAYQSYLRAVDVYERPSHLEENVQIAVDLFRRAVELDPDFALAQARLAEAHLDHHVYGWDRSPQRLELAKDAVDRALSSGPELGETHRAFGRYYFVEGDFDRARAELEAAARSLPGDSDVFFWLAHISFNERDLTAADRLWEKALRLNPRSSDIVFNLGQVADFRREYEKAHHLYERAIALEPDNYWAHIRLVFTTALWKGWEATELVALPEGHKVFAWTRYLVALFNGHYDVALAQVEELPREGFLDFNNAQPRDLLRAWVFEQAEEISLAAEAYDSARNELESLLQERPDDKRLEASLGRAHAGLGNSQLATYHGMRAGKGKEYDLARIYTQVGEADAAVAVLEEMLSTPTMFSVQWMETDPNFGSLRDHPRYKQLVRQYR